MDSVQVYPARCWKNNSVSHCSLMFNDNPHRLISFRTDCFKAICLELPDSWALLIIQLAPFFAFVCQKQFECDHYSVFVPSKVLVPTFTKFFGFLRSFFTFPISFTSLPRIPLGFAKTLISRLGLASQILSYINCTPVDFQQPVSHIEPHSCAYLRERVKKAS